MSGKYQFTCDWFSKRVGPWAAHVGHLSGQPCQLLEIGSLEGRSAVWMLEHLCQHPGSTLTCIDPWNGDSQDGQATRVVGRPVHEQRFDRNIEATGRGGQVRKRKGYSADILPLLCPGFDLIYIDGSHHGCDLFLDIALCWRLLAPAGLLILDDYNWCSRPGVLVYPRLVIDLFLSAFAAYLDVLHHPALPDDPTGQQICQVIVRRTV